ncbi:MAG: protein translocase subunit SecF [Henriciella sp.]|jgi:preprotein translocase SecF subunit|nr:protein translocase subunit SecF [Henriciella sp.]MBF33492.1 protein translocase subunit SecF [Hyphomonadaceae bacterium]MBK75193.1 protein translocase subunit SecF [Henriciella sp.]PHR79905.1 MAG: protein translocase subunit SecF [Henriciella sp.]|tara:strand:- start:2648 stop:3616 length:969 start_codon:yes stop_codon:yes gene_type:complete
MLLQYWPKSTNVPFMSYRLPALLFSAILIAASFALIFTKGLNFGIDFAGGSVIEIEQPEGVQEEDVREVMSSLDLGEVGVNAARGTGVEGVEVIVIRFATQQAEEGMDQDTAQQQANDRVRAALNEAFSGVNVRSSAAVGPKVSGELLRSGLMALGVALLLMMAYISVRFQWKYALGAVAALFHDVIITMGMFALTQFEFNLSTIAALLTIVGYSMNDTVIVFDRVREEARKYKKMEADKVINLAVNQTMSRTLLTSGTTLLALLSIYLFGGTVLSGMSFALIFGIVIGTYSSVFVASAVLLLLGLEQGEKQRKEVEGFQGV